MSRFDPPRIPLWLLEHLTPPEREDALAGDLLEEFRNGRTNGWFWRQALGAWLAAWARYFVRRRSLLLFVLVWSGLAPAWTAVIDRVEQGARTLSLSMNVPLTGLASLMVWLSLQLLFLWVGTVVYFAGFARGRKPGSVLRACGLAAWMFLPVYFATFILMNLFAWPGLDIDRSAMTPLGEIADVRTWAISIRVPYLVTLLCAMWRWAPRLSMAPGQRVAFGNGAWVLPEVRQIGAETDRFALTRFFAFVVGAGLLNAMIAGFLLCRLPDSHAPTVAAFLVRAAVYVALGAGAGIVGGWVYWNHPGSPFKENAPLPFALFAVVCAAGWMWVPAMTIFYEQLSGMTAMVAAIGALLLGAGLRSTTLAVFGPVDSRPVWRGRQELFVESLYETPGEAHGYFIALCLYAGGWALTSRSNSVAAVLLASATFLFAWIRMGAAGGTDGTSGVKAPINSGREMPGMNPRPTGNGGAGGNARDSRAEFERAVVRLACVVIPAVLVTAWALMDGVERRNHVVSVRPAESGEEQGAKKGASSGIGGYESVILWPYPEKKRIEAPVKLEESLLAPGTTRPLVVKFDGPYWYVQPPDDKPGPTAHQAQGTPLKVGIESGNRLPLIMEAHQRLGGLIRLSRCRQIDVDVMNRDNVPGTIAIALRLGNSLVPGANWVQTAEQPMESTLPGYFVEKTSPVFETLHFAVPARARIRSFNEITVMMIPDVGHRKIGPKIAIEQFAFVPR